MPVGFGFSFLQHRSQRNFLWFSTEISLYSIQRLGTMHQDSLSGILLCFRRYRASINAYMKKMFRQAKLAPEQRDFQRIIWRESSADDICLYLYGRATEITTSHRGCTDASLWGYSLHDDI